MDRRSEYLGRVHRTLRGIRHEAGLTQEELHERLNGLLGTDYDRRSVNAWEWGTRPPIDVFLAYLRVAEDQGLDVGRLVGEMLTEEVEL